MEVVLMRTFASELVHTDDWQWRRDRIVNTLCVLGLLIMSWGLVAVLFGMVRRVA